MFEMYNYLLRSTKYASQSNCCDWDVDYVCTDDNNFNTNVDESPIRSNFQMKTSSSEAKKRK